MYRPITSRQHGLFDYTGGVALIAAPWIFGFSDVGGAAVTVPIVIGALILAQSLITNYELGLAKVLPLAAHLALDAVAGAVLALSPLIWQTTDQGTGAWLPHVVVGIALILGALLTEPEPDPARYVGDQRAPSERRGSARDVI